MPFCFFLVLQVQVNYCYSIDIITKRHFQEACDGAHGLTKEFQSEHPDMIVTGESNFLHNIESSTLLASSGELPTVLSSPGEAQ